MKQKPGTKVEVIADSVSGIGKRITTLSARYPRYIHSELMTHRVFSRNASSSRAIPVKRMLKQVFAEPVIPIHWGKNKPGMQAHAELNIVLKFLARQLWLLARYPAMLAALLMIAVGLHKQIANRILEPWMYITVLITATEWDNFFWLRDHPDAHPDIQLLAKLMLNALNKSQPTRMHGYGWGNKWSLHLPYVHGYERLEHDVKTLLSMSSARCARVSYLTHEGKKPEVGKDLVLAGDLENKGHMSPFEHQAAPVVCTSASGNFFGWRQYRKTMDNENRAAYPKLIKKV